MRVPFFSRIKPWLSNKVLKITWARHPDEIIPPGAARDEVYLKRWYLYRNKRIANLYLHIIYRSDDDRALHCHPWHNVSLILHGRYKEVTPEGEFIRGPGEIVFRRATDKHRLVLIDGEVVWTLFLTGPKFSEWGFHCDRGFVHNEAFGVKGCAE